MDSNIGLTNANNGVGSVNNGTADGSNNIQETGKFKSFSVRKVNVEKTKGLRWDGNDPEKTSSKTNSKSLFSRIVSKIYNAITNKAIRKVSTNTFDNCSSAAKESLIKKTEDYNSKIDELDKVRTEIAEFKKTNGAFSERFEKTLNLLDTWETSIHQQKEEFVVEVPNAEGGIDNFAIPAIKPGNMESRREALKEILDDFRENKNYKQYLAADSIMASKIEQKQDLKAEIKDLRKDISDEYEQDLDHRYSIENEQVTTNDDSTETNDKTQVEIYKEEVEEIREKLTDITRNVKDNKQRIKDLKKDLSELESRIIENNKKLQAGIKNKDERFKVMEQYGDDWGELEDKHEELEKEKEKAKTFFPERKSAHKRLTEVLNKLESLTKNGKVNSDNVVKSSDKSKAEERASFFKAIGNS